MKNYLELLTSFIINTVPDKPLSCGAKVWIETTEPVEIIR